MKKLLSGLLLLSLLIGITGCGLGNPKPENNPIAIQCVMDNGAKNKEQAKEWLLYGMKTYSGGKSVGSPEGDCRRTGLRLWKRDGVYTVKEAKEWKKNGFSPKSGHIKKIRSAGYSPSEARRYINLGISKYTLPNISYTERKTTEDKKIAYEKALKDAKAKVAQNNIAGLIKEECTVLGAEMVSEGNNTKCNFKVLKWSDVKLCSVGLKKYWRKAGYSPFETKAWTDAGVYMPSDEAIKTWMRYHFSGNDNSLGGKECFKEVTKNAIVSNFASDRYFPTPDDFKSPNEAKKIFSLGLLRFKKKCTSGYYRFDNGEKENWSKCIGYEAWTENGYSDMEIAGWVNLGLDNPGDAKKLKDFGITLSNASNYINAGVNLGNLEDYKGMTLEEIQDEKAEEDVKYAKILSEVKKKNKHISESMKLINIGKYSCSEIFGFPVIIDVGRTSIEFQGDRELFLIDNRKDYKRYVGVNNDGSKTTFDIITNLALAKESLTNARVQGININCKLIK